MAEKPITLPVIATGVYVLYSNDIVVYVGYSLEGPYARIASALRSFGKKHGVTSMEFYPCIDKAEATSLETALINKLHPAENGQRRGGKSRTSEYGAIIRIARLTAGLTLAELGKSCGYSGAQISRYERGVAPLTDLAQLRLFSRVLDIPPQQLGLASKRS
jgi:Helix-turn-helix domain